MRQAPVRGATGRAPGRGFLGRIWRHRLPVCLSTTILAVVAVLLIPAHIEGGKDTTPAGTGGAGLVKDRAAGLRGAPGTAKSAPGTVQGSVTVVRSTAGAVRRSAVTAPSAAAGIKDTAFPVPSGAVYVSPNGNDTADGSVSGPLRTVASAVRRAPAGGTVVLRAGVYREGGIRIDKRVTLQPAPHEQVWISGSDVISSWVRDGTGWRARDWTSPFCQDCYPAGAIDRAHPLAGLPDQAFIEGAPLRRVGARDAVVRGTFFVDPATKALYLGDDPEQARVEVSARWLALQTGRGAAGSVIRGLGFREFAPHWNQDQLAAVVIDSPDSTVQDNTFTRSAGTSLGVFSGGVVVAGNSVVGNGGPGATFNRADSIVVRGNTFHGNNTRHFIVANCGGYCTMAGLKVTHSASVVIEGNRFTDNDGNGFWCDEGCTAGTVTGNTASGNTGNGLYWEVSSQAVISGNTVTGNGQGVKVSGSDHVTLTRNTFRDNIVQLGLYDDPRSPSTDAYSARLGLAWNTTGTVITGNRFAGGTRTRLLLETNRTGQVDASDMVSEARNNAVSGSAAIVWCSTACTTYRTPAAFTAATGISFAAPGR